MKLLHGKYFNKFNSDQQLFLESWFNMVQEYNLDANRLRIMNPCNILKELEENLLNEHTNKNRLELIFKELVKIFDNDLIIQKDYKLKYQNLKIIYKKLKQNEELIGNELLSEELCNLHNSILEEYHIKSIDWFIDNIGNGIDDQTIITQTSNFLSFLIYKNNQDIGSLFVYLFNILLKAKSEKDLTSKLKLLRRIITEKDKNRCTLFMIEGLKNIDLEKFNLQSNKFRFFRDLSRINEYLSELSNNYLCLSCDKVDDLLKNSNDSYQYCVYVSNDIDGKVAGNITYSLISDYLDILGFDYTDEINVSRKYYFLKEKNGDINIIPHKIDNKVPNPKKFFLEDTDELIFNIKKEEIDFEYLNRIKLALKFYRQGKYSNDLSEKLLNWWTAIENLCVTKKGNIGDMVANRVSTVIANNYFKKIFDNLAISSDELGIQLPKTEVELYSLLNNSNGKILNLSRYTNFYLKSIKSSLDIREQKLIDHREIVKMNIYRIYRARCSIAHNALPTLNLLLLCSSLECYLKITIFSMVSYKNIEGISINKFFLQQELLFDKLISK